MPKLPQSAPYTEAAIWERIIHPRGTMTRAVARRILALEISAEEQQRIWELAERNRAGTLAPGKDEELDDFRRVGNTLSLLKSRARQVLKSLGGFSDHGPRSGGPGLEAGGRRGRVLPRSTAIRCKRLNAEGTLRVD